MEAMGTLKKKIADVRSVAALAAVVWILATVGCTQVLPEAGNGSELISTLSQEQLRQAPAEVQRAYRFALSNQELLRGIPCYCGCVGVGHRSNLDCYLRESGEADEVILDPHGYG